MCCRCIMVLWQNFVLFSPSLSHCTLDFCLHSISSCFLLCSNCTCSFSSSFMRLAVRVPKIKGLCIAASLFSVSLILWNILPKLFLFQYFSSCLKFLSLCWNLYISVPWSTSAWAHQVFASCWKSGCVSQNFSNQNGLNLGVASISSWRVIGQWSETTLGRIRFSMQRYISINSSVTRKRSSRQATCWFPDLRLDHMKVPLLFSVSTNFSYLGRVLNLPLSCSSLLLPPVFSSSDMIMLKSPPKIQLGVVASDFTRASLSMNLIFSCCP